MLQTQLVLTDQLVPEKKMLTEESQYTAMTNAMSRLIDAFDTMMAKLKIVKHRLIFPRYTAHKSNINI